VKYFIVDVLVDQRVVVEINNSHHYKTVDGVTALNLKSQFRERVLERNGYKCYNIRVDDLSASNYSMLEEIHRIVQSSSVTRNG
jgi:very-short-patch-repair endonuclease